MNEKLRKTIIRIPFRTAIYGMALLFSFLTLAVAGVSKAQQRDLHDVEVTVSPGEKVLLSFLTELELESDFIFAYTEREVKSKSIRVTKERWRMDELLADISLQANISFKRVNGTITVRQEDNLSTGGGKDFETIVVTGKVTSTETPEGLPGVNVIIKGTTQGTVTDVNGEYKIEVPLEAAVLVFSSVGFLSEEMTVGAQRVINVMLVEDITALEEIVVVSFGEQKKESVIGSVTTIEPRALKIPSSNLTTALAGRISGMIAYQRSGEPGRDDVSFFIRGVTTFGYKQDPLILLDNNEISSQQLARLQPDDIASFSIMKDATATSLYGSRGANGVILITTKEGAEGKARINIRMENSFSMPTRQIKLADPITYMQLSNEAIRTRNAEGSHELYSQNKIENTMKGGNPYAYPATDWYKTLFKDYAQNRRLNFNLSGGSKVAQYYLAGTLNNDNGVLKVDKRNNFNNNIDLKTYLLRSNVTINVTNSTEVTVRLQGLFDDYSGPIESGDENYSVAMRANPVRFAPYYLPDSANIHTKHILYGNYGEGARYNNPYAGITRGYKEYNTSQIMAQFELKQKLDFVLKGLTVRGLFNTNRYSFFDVIRAYNPFWYQLNRYDKSTDTYTLAPLNAASGTEYLSYSEREKNINSTIYMQGSLSWDRMYNEKHAVSGLLVTTLREERIANAGDLQRSLPYRNLGTAGRFTYAYDSRYFSEFNFGYNGSERFSEAERFGFFPSIGFGWIVSNEAFWTGRLQETVQKLKFKATYGLVGNDAIGSASDRFFYLSNVNMDDGNKGSSFGTYANERLSGVSISRYPNDQITWETAAKLNLGVELNLLGKLEVQADVFSENRENILMDRASIPATMGLQAGVRANVGEASSRGVDLSASYNHLFPGGAWVTGMANFTYATSEFEVYEEPDYSDAPWRRHIGYSLNQHWGYIAERLFVDEEEIRNSPTQFGDYRAGDIKYKDLNGDGKITELDQAPIGFPTSPEISYGFGLSSGWKSIDVSFFFQGLARVSFWIDSYATSPFIDDQNALLDVYARDHWSEENRNVYALWPRLSPTRIDNNNKTSTWFMRNGAFLRLKSLEVGYTLPEKYTSRIRATNFRVYLSGTNLLTFSKFDLWDPEMGGNGLAYPIQKVFNIGLQLSF